MRCTGLPLLAAVISTLAGLAGCADEPTQPSTRPAASLQELSAEAQAELVRELAAQRGIGPLPAPPPVRPALSRLGQMLFFDKVLSGNHDVACATCHLPAFATGDGKSLSVGAGGVGLGPQRSHPQGVFIARNSPPLFNLGAMRQLFWDGRVEVDDGGRFHTPAGAQLTPEMERVLEFGAVSAQPMFPVTSSAEMRGDDGNELAAIPDDDVAAIWAGLMRRLGQIPEYRGLFQAAYPGTRFEELTFAHASNAIAGFLVDRLSFADSPWDRFLAGDDGALSAAQLDGAETFMTLRCSVCHGGPAFSDHQFHDVAVAQIGPGAGNGDAGRDDFGRMNVTGSDADRYGFRTTPLRNVELTGPYGHDGAYTTLRGFVEHYSASDVALSTFDASPLEPALRGTFFDNVAALLAQRDPLLQDVVLDPAVVDRIVAYLQALTDPAARDLSRLVPPRVPSGLPVDRP